MNGNGRQPYLVPVPSRRPRPRVAVLLSQRLASLSSGLDLPLLQAWLRSALSGVEADVLADPARRPGEIAQLARASGAERLVIGLAPAEQQVAEVQAQARKAGVDPLGVQTLNLGAQAALWHPQAVAMERAKLLLAAAVARSRSFRGSRPAHLKASISVAMSRRSLFTLSAHEYRAVPSVSADRCAAERGCRSCLAVCPSRAVQVHDLQIEIDRARCESCGLCLGVCPAEAIAHPGQSLDELDAQLATLLDPTLGGLDPRGVLFACRQSALAIESSVEQGARYPAAWLPVVVPCAGMLSPALFLRCLALGAAAVGVAGCASGCPFGQDRVIADRIGFSRELLGRLGDQPGRVTACAVSGPKALAWPLLPARSAELPAAVRARFATHKPESAAAALRHLAEQVAGAADFVFEHPASPFGVLEIEPASCTGCETCAQACPTGALVAGHDNGAMAISFDPAGCTACGLCAQRCPETARGALRLRPAVDLPRLAAGRSILYRDRTSRCQSCGTPIASTAMMARLRELLDEQYDALAETIGRYCPSCRGGLRAAN